MSLHHDTTATVEDSGLTSLALASIVHARSPPSSEQIKPALRRPLRRHHRPWEDDDDEDVSSSASSTSSPSSTAESWTNHGAPDLTSRHRPLPPERNRAQGSWVKLETDLGGSRDHLHHQQEGSEDESDRAGRTRARSRAKRVKVEEPAQLLGEAGREKDDVEQEQQEEAPARRAIGRRGKASSLGRPVPASPSRLPSLPLLLPSAPFLSHPPLPTTVATPTIFIPSPPSAPSPSSLVQLQPSYDAVLHYYLSLAAWCSSPHPLHGQPQQPYPHVLPEISLATSTSTSIASSSDMPWQPLHLAATTSSSYARCPPVEPSPPSPSSPSQPGYVFRDETDKLALAAERRRRRSLTTPSATRESNRQALPERPQRSPPSDAGQQAKSESVKNYKNEEPSTGGEGNERQATWRDRQGSFTFHTLESLEASKKKGGRVRLKWRKDP